MKSDLWERLLLALVGAKLLVALLGVVLGVPSPTDHAEGTFLAPLLLILPVCVYGLGGAILLLGGSGDRRATLLGIFFLLLATPFSNRPLLRLVESGTLGLDHPALILSSLSFDAFLPYFLWRFVGEFPTTVLSFRTRRLLGAGTMISLLAGIFLFGFYLVELVVKAAESIDHPVVKLSQVAPAKPSYGFYSVVLSLSLLALVFLLTRIPRTTEVEKRRALVFVAGLSAMAPFLIVILVDAVLNAFHRQWEPPGLLHLALFLLFCSVPFTTGYAVAVHHVLNVRLIARKALQYALARYSAIGLAVVPLAALVV
ncbi:MAG TPA: hypothetical protein VIJ36_10660, partial [Thermoanaerobaculia bacterium]